MNSARPFQKARSVNSSSANFPTWVSSELVLEKDYFADAGTAAGRVVTRLSNLGGNGIVPCWMKFMPYGLGNDNDAFSVKLVGVTRIMPPLSDGRIQVVRQEIAVLAATISAAVGVAGGNVLATERFADTIAITREASYTADVTRSGSIKLYSPVNDFPAYALIPLLGFEGYEIEWDQTTGTPTMNALISFLDGGGE